jgi:excisionase family DNA binding protein
MSNTVQTAYCTTREAAHLLGVSLRTAQLWAEGGLIEAWKTKGGHRRISRSSVQRMLLGEVARPGLQPAPDARLARLKVLIIEDDIVLLKLYKAVLSSWNLPVDVIAANNGVEGLIHIGRDAPDLMITDLLMPGLDGLKLIHSLVGSRYRDGMEIVVVTGMDKHAIAAQGGLPKDVRWFPKPVPFGELQTLLFHLLERRATYL